MLAKKVSLFLLICSAFAWTSCTKSKIISSIEKETLFSLEYGNFEDQINVFDLSGIGNINTTITMKDGFFYVNNSESKKIMEMNSYGDLITLFYNEAENPKPSFAASSSSNSVTAATSTREAVTYPFNEVTDISVDSRKYLYAVDKLPPERQEFDAKNKQSLNQVILRFDENKKFLDYLGQQGPGGTPFPFVKNIFTTDKNELVVLCHTLNGFIVYWFSDDGFLMYTIPIEKSNVPNPFKDEKNETFYSLSNVVPDIKERKLYMKIDYFASFVDESSRVQSGIEYLTTLVYPFNVETASYEEQITIPPYSEMLAEGFSKETFDVPYDFLGVTESGWLFFIVSTEEGFCIQMVQNDGQKILKRKINFSREENIFYTFNLSREGIVSALLVQKNNATVDWWRLDNLIQAVIRN